MHVYRRRRRKEKKKTCKYKVEEVEGAKGSAWFTDTKHNVFLDSGDNDFSPEHVRNRFLFPPFPIPSSMFAFDMESPGRQI